MNLQPLISFLPELSVGISILVYLLLTLKKTPLPNGLLSRIALYLTLLTLLASWVTWRAHDTLFFNTYRVDLYSQSFKFILSIALFVIVLLSDKTLGISDEIRPEYFMFLSSASLGLMMLTSASELLTLYVSLELSSYSLYLLVALRNEKWNAEAGIKYLLLGAVASGLLLYGMSLVIGLAQSPLLADIAVKLPEISKEPAFLLGVLFILFSFFFKLSAFPFHFWAPDVYEASNTQITAFIASASKAAAAAVLIRLLLVLDPSLASLPALIGISVVSMTLGNVVALVQKDMKRLLAYSSIAQAGYIVVGLMGGKPDGFVAVMFYAFAYVVMNLAAFMVTIAVARDSHFDNPQVSSFNGLADRSPLLALVLLLSLLSLAGIPPLAGFTGKWLLFMAAMGKGHWFIVLLGVINSIISLFYYLIVVKHAYFEKSQKSAPFNVPFSMKLLSYAFIIALLTIGIFPTFFVEQAHLALAFIK